jgi:hypothetical protein
MSSNWTLPTAEHMRLAIETENRFAIGDPREPQPPALQLAAVTRRSTKGDRR